ncbi:MAG: tetratricopeptide repeat protein [Ruminococcus flavefaciens]|nr:tetratricopeptide repeat protein [Ruminococcus flavefaciens]
METYKTIDNTTLFQFEFTDRKKEQEILQSFLDYHSSKVLWIYGKSGTGKTFFVQHCIKQCNVIYVENKKNSEAGSCILNLINELQGLSTNSFCNFIHNHFQSIKAVVQDIPPLKQLSESNFLQYALSKNFYFVDKANQFNDLAAILQQYINHVLNEASLVFIIDNFDQCDENSVDILLNFAKCNINNKRRKFIFISTDNESDLTENEIKLEREIPCKNLPIPAIPNEDYFINMLPTVFDISNLRENDINRIYEVCHGLPEKLQDLLLNLNKANAIEYSNEKISFNLSIMEKYILSNGVADLEIDKFSPIEQCILLVVICIGVPLYTDLLLILAQNLYNVLFGFSISEIRFQDALQEMLPKPLNVNFNMGNKIYTDHDLTFGAALLFFKENNMYRISCDIIFRYLEQNMPERFKTCFSESSQKEIFANLSYNALCSSWILLNLECGKYFYEKDNYIQATKYFNRFLSSLDLVSEKDRLYFAIANYEVGLYKNAYNILLQISAQTIIEDYTYNIYAGKILNMNGKYELAAENFKKAVELSEENTDNQMYAKYMLHIILTQIPDRWNDAANIYKSLAQFIRKAYSAHNDLDFYKPCNAKILKCCYNFYFNQDSLEFMDMAEMIADNFQMITEKAFILNNKGFEYIRQNDNQKGMDCFKESYDILIKTKQHEAAYALNNIGICQMFDGNYNSAILSFKEALLYQKSYYLQLTTHTMLMQCYSLTNSDKQEDLEKKLKKWVDEHPNDDPAIIRKICMNLSIYLKRNQMLIEAKYYLDKIIDNVAATSSEYRALKLRKELYDVEVEIDKQYVFRDSKYFKELLFDPWFITLSHD